MNNIKVRTKLVIVMVIALIDWHYAPSFPTQACQDLEIMR